MRYIAIVECGDDEGWGAYVPDFSGCIAAAQTREEIISLITGGMAFHIQGMLLEGLPLPERVSDAITVTVPFPGSVRRQYLVIIERGKEGKESWGAYAPDVPGCAAVGDTREEVEKRVVEALESHFEGLLLAGLPIPEPVSDAIIVDVPVPDLAAIA